jgi:signal transduction histidine kinase
LNRLAIWFIIFASSKTIKVSFSQAGDIENKLNSQQKLMIFRIIQEQVNNVLKHAQAKHLIIYLVSDKDRVYLEVTDDGKGFDPNDNNNKKGVGLSNIISRADLFNGKVSIVSSPGEGCKMEVKIPLKIS